MTLCVLSNRAVFSKLDTIICSRDKDLRICPGMHFGWETSVSPQFGPTRVSELGELNFTLETKINKRTEVEYQSVKSLKGTGFRFFCAQLIMGDTVDNIPGLPNRGKEYIHTHLAKLETQEELMEAVINAYKEIIGEGWEAYLLEQGRLLHMVRELDDDGKPVMWEIPYGETWREDTEQQTVD